MKQLLVAAVAAMAAAVAQDPPRTYAFTNGRWFDGTGFESRSMYSVDGILTTRRPQRVAMTVDLEGKYVVPPFADAHNHNLGDARGLEAQIAQHLRAGIFYSKNQHYVRELTAPMLDRVNRAGTVDVAYAHAGLAASGGHAVALYEGLFERGIFPGWHKEDLDTRAFFTVDTEADLSAKWPAVLAGTPDFIKTYLEYSEEYEARRSDSRYVGQRGLDPRLLRLIVDRAHQAGLRVSTHIETAADFHNALAAGVDEVAHLPGYRMPSPSDTSRYEIADADARLAASRGVFVVTTTAVSASFYRDDPARLGIVRRMQARNLRLLKAHGVRLAIGTDVVNTTALTEITTLGALGVFNDLELLRMWCETTPATIFPARRLGRLRDGYEASFLVLDGNPLEDIANTSRVTLRFKQGEFIIVPPPRSQAA